MGNPETLNGSTRKDLPKKPIITAWHGKMLALATTGVLAFTMIGCGDSEQPTSPVSTLTSQDIIIRLTGSESVFQYTRPMNLTDGQPPALYPQTSLDNVRERMGTIFETPDNHRKIIEEKDIMLNGYKATRIKFVDYVSGARIIYFKYFIATGSDVWEITFQVNDDQQASVIERAMQTLKPVK